MKPHYPAPLSAVSGIALFLQSATGAIRFKNASDSFGLRRRQVGVCAVKNVARVNDSLCGTALIFPSLAFPVLSVKSLGGFHNIYPSAF